MKATLYHSFFRPSSGPRALRLPGSRAKLLAFNKEGCNHFRRRPELLVKEAASPVWIIWRHLARPVAALAS